MFIHEQFASLADVAVGKYAYITCIHGDTQPYLIAHLSLTTGEQERHIRVAVACHLAYPVVGWGETVAQ